MTIRTINISARTIAVLGVYLATVTFTQAEAVNKDSKTIADFEKRVAAYVKLHNEARSGLAPAESTGSPAAIAKREHELAGKIRALRSHAKRGAIFDRSSSAEMQRLVRISSQGKYGQHIRTSLARSEPVDAPIHVNDSYPVNLPLQSTPSTLLQNLPPLPKEVEYRILGKKLVLRDVEANLIVDYTDDVIR